MAMIIAETSFSEAVIFRFDLIFGGCSFRDGLCAMVCTKSLAYLLSSGCSLEILEADLIKVGRNVGIDNKAVLVVVAKSVVELVLSDQLESSRSNADQRKKRVHDFHFLFWLVNKV